MYHTLQLVLILLGAAVLIVVLFRFLRLPPLLGYLLIGVALSPHAFGLIPDTEETHTLAEIGVVFLMFSIGLEFSLPRLSTMKRLVFGLGLLQVGLTMALVVAVAVAWGLDLRTGVVLGGVFAMSSTAIVGKMLEERFEINSQHGRQIMAVLLFQDLAVVPLLIVIPALSAPPETLHWYLPERCLKPSSFSRFSSISDSDCSAPGFTWSRGKNPLSFSYSMFSW